MVWFFELLYVINKVEINRQAAESDIFFVH